MPGTRKLGKPTDQRMAMLRQQVTDFLDNGKMETTLARAKEIKPLAEKMITLGKKSDLAAYRQAMSFITVQGDRSQLCRAQRRLHPRDPHRRAPRRCRGDRHHRAGEVRTRNQKSPLSWEPRTCDKGLLIVLVDLKEM